MNFYSAIKNIDFINEEKSFISGGIQAAAKAVNDGHKVGFLTARTNKDNHMPLLRQIMIMVAVEMSNDIKDFKINLKKVKSSFKSEFFFFVNDNLDMNKKLSSYVLPNIDPMISFVGSTDQKKAYVLKVLSDVYSNKFKFFDDEEKNLVTAKKIESKYPNIKSYDIRNFDKEKLKNKNQKNEKIFLFDIDGTLIDAQATVWILKPDGKREGLTQEEFATGKFKLDIGDKFDFSEFANREHLKKLSIQFSEIIRKTMIDKFFNMDMKIDKAKISDDEFLGFINNKKISVKKMHDNSYLMNYDGTISKSHSFIQLLKNIKKYFSKVTSESITNFSEARILKLGLKRIDKQNNDIYRFKNYSVYLNHFDEDNDFAFIKEERGSDDYLYLLTERDLKNYEIRNINKVFDYIEENKSKLNKWTSMREMIVWLKDNRHLPINESYFRDIMLIED